MNPLFETETAYTLDELKKFNFNVNRKKFVFIYVFFFVLIAASVFKSVLIGFTVADGAFIAAIIFSAALFSFLVNKEIKTNYNSNKQLTKTVAKMEFYENEFIEKTDRSNAAIKYEDLYRIIESKTNFYLMVAKNQGAIIVKKNCTEDLIEFIKNLKSNN